MKIYLSIAAFILSYFLFAQNGPGGVGNAEGLNQQPANLVWLDAGDLSLLDGDDVTSWPDKSGNANDFIQLGSHAVPLFETEGLASASYSTVTFDGTERYLSLADNATLDALPELSLIVVFKSSVLGGNPRGIISKRNGFNNQDEYALFSYSNDYLNFDLRSGSNNRSAATDALTTGTDYIVSTVYDGSDKEIFLQSAQTGSTESMSGTIDNGSAPVILGALNESYGTYFGGDIAEVIVYRYGLNTAQRLIVENYLSEKYNIAISNDLYGGHSGAYIQEVAGIGQRSSESHEQASSAGFLLTSYDGTIDDNEFILAGHSGGTNSVVATELSGSLVARWSRDWYVDVEGSSFNVAIGFDFGDGIEGQYPQTVSDYRLLKWNGSSYDEVTTLSSYVTDDQLYFRVVDPTDGYYTLGTVDSNTAPLEGGTQRVWYSYRSGNWEDPLSWTLDGAISALYVNPADEYPTAGDKVVIKSGRSIDMRSADGSTDFNNATIASLEIIGTLDIGTSYGHSFGAVKGSGKLILEGSSVDDFDNFPSGDFSDFTGVSGGTVEFQGDGLDLNAARTFRNLIVNLDAGSIAVLTADYTINGDWSVNSGTVQINNTSTIARTISVFGDLIVAGAGSITTGTGDARHQLNLYGDFDNNGSVAFTQRTSQTVGSEATDGIVDANFLNDTENQSVHCGNTTLFYRIEVDKGEDDTYILNIDADDDSYFGLYGYASQGHGTTGQLTSNTNALGLLKGTVRIGSHVIISALSVSGNYNVSEAATLWVDGGSVTMAAGNAIVPYGGILVSGGSLTASVTSGITTRGNGYLEVSGGKVKMNQFRTSIFGSDNQGGYSQSGGETYVTGGSSTNGSYYSFSATYEGNTFTMSGGILTVVANNRGGIFINGSEGNYNVQGGEIVCEVSYNRDFNITSKAPFYNVTVRRTADVSRSVMLTGGSTSGGTDDVTLEAQPLVVLNDLTIQNSTDSYTDFDGNASTPGFSSSFDANDNDVSIVGNLTVSEGSSFSTGDNTLTFNGSGLSNLSFGTTATQELHNLVINKKFSAQGVEITNGNATAALQINGAFNLTRGRLRYSSFNVHAHGSVILEDTVGRSGYTGKFIMNGSTSQTLNTGGDDAIYNLELDNANGVVLDGALSILGDLTLTSGVFDIQTYRLLCINPVVTSGTFSSNLMIQTAGNASDKGLAFYVNGVSSTASILFPIGTDRNAVRYTPLTATLSSIDNDGYLILSVSDSELQTVNLSELSDNMLTYYWRVRHEEFDDGIIPTVDGYLFTASDSDDSDFGATPVGFDSNFVPGKVLDENPYTRSQESPSAITGLEITFDGGGVGFPLENANYTAGDGTTNLFVGAPTVFYTTNTSRQNWDEESKWSTTDDGIDDGNTGYPGAGDIAVIKSYGEPNANAWVNINSNITVSELIFDNSLGGYLPRAWVLDRDALLDLGPVSGVGTFFLEVTASEVPSFIGNTDLGTFSTNAQSVFNFKIDSDNQIVDMPSSISEYPNLRIEAGNGVGDDNNRILQTSIPIVVNGYARMDRSPRWRINHDVTIKDDLRITWQENRTTLEIGDDREVTLEIQGDLRMENGSGNDGARLVVKNDNLNGFVHTIKVGGDIEIESGLEGASVLDLYNGSGTNNNAVLELIGEGDHSFTNSSSTIFTPDLYRLVINKDRDTSSVFTFNNNFLLNGLSDGLDSEDKALVLENGKLVLNDPSINIDLATGGGDFEIPSTSGLEVTQGNVFVSGDDVGIRMDGLLRINGGMVDMDDVVGNGNNYIEYSSSGSAVLDISSGSLIVGSQVRRGPYSTSGILNYKQTGGTVVLGKNAAPETSRGILELTNLSDFVHTGGTLTLVRGINSSVVPSLLLDPATSEVAGSSITIGNGDTPSGTASSSIGIKSAITLDNLTIDNSSGSNPTVWLYSLPLTVSGTLANPTGATFNANSFGLILNGDFVNDGTYTPSGNTTTFSKTSGSQSFTGSGTALFYNFVKAESGVLDITQDITIENNFTVSEGTLDLDAHAVLLTGDATIQSTVASNGGNGIVFQGSTEQQLIGKSNVTVSVGAITIDNTEGVKIPDGNGYLFTIDERLRLSEGVLDIGGSLLTIAKNGSIDEVNPFTLTNMIQTNSSLSDNGVRKVFNGSETSFVFPVGETKYTPMILSIASIDEDGDITVRPANEIHPAVTDDVSTLDDEMQNALQYHWILKSSGLSGATSGEAQFIYDQSDVSVTGSFTESDYEPARLIFDQEQWDKAFGTGEVDEVINTINFPLSESSSLGGEYTAGIDNAFRDVPEYRSTDGIVFSSEVGWEVYDPNTSTWEAASTKPVGARVTILSGHSVSVDENLLRLLSTTIESGARLVVDESVYGARLGAVSGSGRIVLSSEVLPAGDYSDFFTCSGGELEYTSSNSYSILSGIPNIKLVALTGSGTRTLPSNAVYICDALNVDGPTLLKNTSDDFTIGGDLNLINGTIQFSGSTANMTVDGNTALLAGSFIGYNGADITFNGDLSKVDSDVAFTGNSSDFSMSGSSIQEVSGNFIVNKLTISNTGDGIDLTGGGNITIDQMLTMTDGIVTTSASNIVTLTSAGAYTGASDACYFNGPVTKNAIAGSDNFTFPVGKGGRYAAVSISNVVTGLQDWTAEYFTNVVDNSIPTTTNFDSSDPGSGLNALIEIKTTDRWSVTSSGSNSAFVSVSYGSHNAFANASSARITWWDATDGRWENVGDVVTGNQNTGTVRSSDIVHFSSQQFGLGNAPESILPVDLVYFMGTLKEDGVVQLDWQTASEIDNDRFEVERLSKNGAAFEKIGALIGAGVSDELVDYRFLDTKPFYGLNYYRLKQVDYNGKAEYSDIIVVTNDSYRVGIEITLLPNPTTEDQVRFQMDSGDEVTMVNVKLIDMLGRIFFVRDISPQLGRESYWINPQRSMQQGMYFLVVTQGQNIQRAKLIIK